VQGVQDVGWLYRDEVVQGVQDVGLLYRGEVVQAGRAGCRFAV
jgi:hypothetical protein